VPFSPITIGQADQSAGKLPTGSTAGPSLASLATIVDNRPIQRHRHMGNNDSSIWAITLLTYGQQRQRDMTNNAIVIWATTISAYNKQRQRDMTNNGAGICALPHIENGNHYHQEWESLLLKTRIIPTRRKQYKRTNTPPAGPYTPPAGP
jgi:hypothetical protein